MQDVGTREYDLVNTFKKWLVAPFTIMPLLYQRAHLVWQTGSVACRVHSCVRLWMTILSQQSVGGTSQHCENLASRQDTSGSIPAWSLGVLQPKHVVPSQYNLIQFGRQTVISME